VKITFITGRFRVGATSTEAYVTNFWNEDEGGVYLPVHVGFSLLTRAHKTLAFYNMAPDIYAEVATAFWLTGIVPFVRGSLYAGVEKSAVGIGVEAGVMSLGWGSSDWREHGSFVRSTHPYVALRFKLLTFSIGLKPH
jgi:hypothetical protein